ncbi:MAG: tetratricopeptide repeat protein, partial [Planctomycetota bacterium]
MAIDSYAPCPGGTGKKLKFCCPDLIGDLEQLDRLIEGDQISAALDQVKRLEEKTPGRPCLLATRTKLELGTKQFPAAAETSRRFLEACPDNPLALGHAAISDAIAGRIQEAASLFDKARDAALGGGGKGEGGGGVVCEVVGVVGAL